MPKVVISGYYGFHNSGDEAMLHAMLLALRDAVPGLEVTVLSKNPDYTARNSVFVPFPGITPCRC
ncbi:hypothetical protein PTH_2779 [Pelotomaculum thermopropionicum SI]|uniref:Polysaccharide pyruvyl transferase domain-containing protein n=1 Tax=Pelotomaculum thermopropionicum (strain DSM 13744 / JCM 10971 / SI) TaxID=370438 RepID=A5CYH7_PELTS|nr:hypothetical protein PTH_2779 [Pelotomaculum thermopropionicum SI]